MKKIFSLLCATLLVFSASAAPVAKKAEIAKKAVAVEQMQKVQFEQAQPAMKVSLEQAQIANFNQLSATPELKVINQEAKALAKAPQATQAEPIVVIIKGNPQIVSKSGKTTIEATGNDDIIYGWVISTESLEAGKTYTYADMGEHNVYRYDNSFTVYEEATDGTFSIDAEKNITASMVTESGTYLVYTNDPTPQPSYDTIPVTVTAYQAKYYASSLDWQVIMQDAAGNGYSFDIFAPAEGLENGKTYTSDNGDFDLEYTFASIVVNKVNEAAVKASFTKTETEDALTVTAEMTTAGNHVYQFSYNLDKTVEIVDAHGIIIQPAKGTTKEYNRLATNTCFYVNSSTGKTSMAYQSGTATLVECADGTVYWQNPVSKYTTGAWIKGKKEGSTITFATKQLVSYNSTYKATLSVRWGNFDTQKFAVADDYAESFILDIKGDSLIMRGTQATTGSTATYFPGIFYDDDDSFGGYGDCGVNLYIPGWTPSTELITPPAGLVTAKMPFTGSGAAEEYADTVLVGWDKDTVYIQGLAVDFPTAWIKGVLKEGVVTFEKFQYVGKYGTMPIWVLGTNADSELLDFTMTYDAQANLFKATNIFVVNASYEKIYYLDKVSKIVIGEVAQADWGEWEDFAPFGFNTGSWTFVAMATSPTTFTNYVALVRTDKNNADNKQIKITNWGEGWFGEGVELIINWNAKDNTCSIDKQFTGYVNTQYGNVYVASVEDGTYDPETATFSIKVDYTVSAGSFGKDVETYVMDAKQPGMMYDTDAPFDATFEYTDMSTDLDEGVIGIYATNAEGLTIGLELYADPTATKIPEGVYTISDTQEAGTALQSLGVAGGYLTECWAGVRTSSGISDCWFMVEGTITLSYDEYDKLKVVVDAKNSYGQPVTALVQYVKLEPKKTVDFTDAELYVYDGYVERYGIMNFYGGNADGYEFDLYAYSSTVAGDFLEAIDFGDCELTSPAGSIGIIDAYEFKVEADGKNLTLTAKVLGSDTVQYNITAIGYLGYIDGDAKEAYEGEFAVEEIAAQQIAISKVNYIYIQGLNAAGDKFQLVVEGEMEDEAIAAGEYTNVMASTGYDAQEQLNPSFVTDADNNDWFIQSGKLTVNENGSMVFEGVNSYDASVVINVTVPAPEVTDYYLVGWINNAAYGIEGDIDNFGDYHFVDGKVKATFNELSYVQVKDNNKQIYGTDSYIAPVESGNATLVANGPEKIAINGGVEYEYTLVVNEDGSLTLSYEVVKTALDNINAGKKAAKAIKNGMIVIEKDGKAYNVLGIAL
ncbi:MAG: hypothetical protein MJZ84_05045 [Paludibacteraceae bacterium]|nr:hypothetical protein [Paludibacteraceae bacterium]